MSIRHRIAEHFQCNRCINYHSIVLKKSWDDVAATIIMAAKLCHRKRRK